MMDKPLTPEEIATARAVGTIEMQAACLRILAEDASVLADLAEVVYAGVSGPVAQDSWPTAQATAAGYTRNVADTARALEAKARAMMEHLNKHVVAAVHADVMRERSGGPLH